MFGAAIPAIGIYQEMELSERVAECYRHYHEIYIAYCVVNFFRYLSSYGVRVLLIYTTLYLSKTWFPKVVPAHTSIGRTKILPTARPSDFTSTNNTYRKVSGISIQTECHGTGVANRAYIEADVDDDNGLQSVDVKVVSDKVEMADAGSKPHDVNNHEIVQKVLEDWKAVSSDYQSRFEKYNEKGEKVQVIQELFQTWFVVPWLVYFVASSLQTYNILRPWDFDGDGNTPPSTFPAIYYLLYNINQIITLIIPFLCVKKMNTYHHKYYIHTVRNGQIKEFENDPSRLSFARQLKIDQDSRFDFVPRIVGTNIKIPIGNPLFVIILLVGLFLSVSESIL